jgi:hypothetical protein
VLTPTLGATRRGGTRDSRLVIHHSLTPKAPMGPDQGKWSTAYGDVCVCVCVFCSRKQKESRKWGKGPQNFIGGNGGWQYHSLTTCLFFLYSWRVRLQATVIWQRPSTSQREAARASGILCHRRRHYAISRQDRTIDTGHVYPLGLRRASLPGTMMVMAGCLSRS